MASSFGLSSSAQTIRLEMPSPKYPPTTTLKVQDRQQIIKTAEALINDYAKTATLLDEAQRKVNGSSIDRFRALFNPTAMIVKDFEENIQTERINVRTYTEGVFQRMERQGVRVKMGKAILKEIKDDPAGYWVVVIELEKLIYNAVSADQVVKNFSSGRFMKQEISVDIKKSDLERAKIAGINRIGGSGIADQYVRYLGPSVGAYMPFVNPSMSSFWQTSHAATSTMNVKGEVSFSGGFDFLTNKMYPSAAEHKNLFLTAGLHFSYLRLTTELRDFSIAPFDATASDGNGNDTTYQRLVGPLMADEKLNIGLVEIPLGVTYRLKKSIKSDIMLSAKLIPTIVLSGSGDVSGKGTYDAMLDNAMWRVLELDAINLAQTDNPDSFGPFQAGEDMPIKEMANPTLSSFMLTARVSPSVYFHLSENNSSWSLLLGFDLNFHLGSFLKHDDADTDVFHFSDDDYQTSLLQHYTDGLSAFSAGLRIGLHHRLTSKP